MASAEVSSPTKVKFDTDDVIERQKLRQPPTQRYDRKEVQKRLDIEQWMDEQLKRLFGCKVCETFHFVGSELMATYQ